MKNRQWVLARHALGEVDESTWKLVATETKPVQGGQILIEVQWLSVDPYMRGKINVGAGMQPGDLMLGGGVGRVIESRHPDWQVGDIAEGLEIGWQAFATLTPDQTGPLKVNKVNPSMGPGHTALSWLGMPGLTAYFALLEVAQPRAGDTVVISAAAGAVGQVAGQLAKIAGCRVIGIAGSDQKLAWCKSIGFDETVNYKNSDDLHVTIAGVCPEGVNVFFDGTGGAVHDAVMRNLALHARVVIVGRVAVANRAASEDVGLRASSNLIGTRASVHGFVVYDWWSRREEALRRLSKWHMEGHLKFKEDILQGIENVPNAFVRMMKGQNQGKQLVQL